MTTVQDLVGWGTKPGDHLSVEYGSISSPYHAEGKVIYITRDKQNQINEVGLLDQNENFKYKLLVSDDGEIIVTERRVA